MKTNNEIKTNESNIYENYFALAVFGLFVLWFILFSIKPHSREIFLFFRSFEDLFADFFNVLRYVSERDVYFNEVNGFDSKEYLPLAYVIFYPFSRWNNYAQMSLSDCWNSTISLYSCFLFLFINLFLLFHSLSCLCKKYKVSDKVIYALFCSNIMLSSAERANIVFLAVTFLNYFITFYDSESKKLRYFAAFSLAFSATLKIFPVIFIVMYIPTKQYKEFIATVITGLLLAFLPFLFFKHGFGNIAQLYNNVRGSAAHDAGYFSGYGGILPIFVHRFFGVKLGLNANITLLLVRLSKYLVILASIASFFLFFIQYKTLTLWEKVELLMFPLIFFPNTNKGYCGLYLFCLTVLFFATTKDRTKLENIFFTVLLIIAFAPVEIFKSGINRQLHEAIFLLIGFYTIFLRIKFLIANKAS